MKVLIMIYSNQEASLNKTEQRDFMLAIKALLQDQKEAKRDEHHDLTKEILRETSGQEISNTAKRSLSSAADKSDPPATVRTKSQNQAPLDPRASESKRQLRDLESSASIAAVQSPGSPPGTTNYRRDQPRDDNPAIQVRPRPRVVCPDLPEPKLRMGIHLFLLKPVVENFFDKVELTWLLQNIQMRESAIHGYLNQQNYERNDVFDMLQILHPYEQKILDGVIFGVDMSTEGSLLSLKRTKTTIRHRDITFTDVPGLQFVVRREDRIPDAVPPNIPEPPRSSPRMSSRRRPSRPGRYHYSDDSDSESEYEPVRERTRPRREFWWQREDPAEESRNDVVENEGWPCVIRRRSRSRAHRSREHRSRAASEPHDPRCQPVRNIRRAWASSDSEDLAVRGFVDRQEPMSLPGQDEDAVIDDMLKRYTTLFD